MTQRIFLILLPLALSGCLSFGGSSPPARNTTIIVPPNSQPTVVCSDGTSTPCN